MFPDWSKRMLKLIGEDWMPVPIWTTKAFMRYWSVTDRWYGY